MRSGYIVLRSADSDVMGSNSIGDMWEFLALNRSYLELGVILAQWEAWGHTES